MNNRSMITVLSLIALLGAPGNVWGMRKALVPVDQHSVQGESNSPEKQTEGKKIQDRLERAAEVYSKAAGNDGGGAVHPAKMSERRSAGQEVLKAYKEFDVWKKNNPDSTISPRYANVQSSESTKAFVGKDSSLFKQLTATTTQKVGLMAVGGLLLTGIIGSVLYATGALSTDKDGIKFNDSDAKVVQQVADMLKYDTTLPTNETLDAAIDNSTLDPLIITISQNQLFGRTLTSEEMTECSQLINRQQKSSEMLSQLLDTLGKEGQQLSVKDKATIKKLELLHNDNQKSFYLKELYIRYNIDRAAIDEDLSPRYQAIKDKLAALLDDAGKQSTLALEDQSLSDAYKAFLTAQTNNLQSELAYVEDRRQVEEQATAMLKVINNLQDKTAEEKAANFMSQYTPLVQALDSTLMIDQRFSMRNEAEPYESSRNRTVAIFEGKAQPVPFMFQEPIVPAADQSADRQEQPEMIMMPAN